MIDPYSNRVSVVVSDREERNVIQDEDGIVLGYCIVLQRDRILTHIYAYVTGTCTVIARETKVANKRERGYK